jgi:ABC-2 type transport system permease protein
MSAAEVVLVGNPPRARVSTRFLRSELKIIFGRRRNIAGLGVLAVVPVILAISVRLSSPNGEGGVDIISGITGNGPFVAFAALALELPLFLPLAVSAISGDSVAGEANLGTLRYLLAVPAGRTRLLLIKYTAIVIFALVATLIVALVGTIMGLALFGGGDMTLLSGTQTSMADGVWRLLLSSFYLAAQFSALGAIGLFVSTLTEQPLGATIAIVLVDVLMFILDSISQLDWLHP